MKNKEIKITISGEVSSGKSRLIYFLKKFLRDEGFVVNFDGGMDFETQEEFDRYMMFDLDTVLNNLKANVNIEFEEKQIKRDV